MKWSDTVRGDMSASPAGKHPEIEDRKRSDTDHLRRSPY